MSRPEDTVILPENPSIRPAFPVGHKAYLHSEWNGLTKREYVATHLLTGLLAHPQKGRSFKRLAATAVVQADELLKQLIEAPL